MPRAVTGVRPALVGGLMVITFLLLQWDFSKVHQLAPGMIGSISFQERSLTTSKTNVSENQISSKGNGTTMTSATAETPVYQIPRRNWAYAFLIGGCDPEKSIDYLGYIYNVVIASGILHEHGSVADVVVMVQMSSGTNATKLPFDHESMLTALPRVSVRYLPKPEIGESFYSVVMEKFRVLELTEYSRVLFLDSDLMPFCSLDYLLEMSEPQEKVDKPLLRENVIMAWTTTPANAGSFILTPRPGDWDLLQKIWKERQLRDYKELPYPHFDKNRGWGKVMKAPYDYALNYGGKKYNFWDWYGVIADQGLLYYWVKYVKKDVSAIIWKIKEDWLPVTAEQAAANLDANWTVGEDVAPSRVSNLFAGRSCVTRQKEATGDPMEYAYPGHTFVNTPPFSDFKHFTGRDKPWENPINYTVTSPKSAEEYWFHRLALAKATVLKDNPHLQTIDIADLPKRRHGRGEFPTFKSALDLAKQLEKETSPEENLKG